MQTISRSLSHSATVGDPIDMPWRALNDMLGLHTKELVLVAGAPGAGKSVFALNVAMSLDYPVLYLAMDSVPSVLARIAALALGEEINWVYDQLRDPETKEEVVADLKEAWPDLYINPGSVSVEGIDEMLEALTEIQGEAPKLIILDNLIDLEVEGYTHTDMGFYAKSLNALKILSWKHNTCVMALHHVTRAGGDRDNPHGLGSKPLKMTDLLYSGEREAEHVLGVYHNKGKTYMNVQILKQRDGDAEGDGSLSTGLMWHPPLGKLGRI